MMRREFLAGTAALATAGILRGAEQRPRRIRVGQIGTKHAHAAGHFATLRKYPDLFDVVGIVEPDLEQRRRVQGAESYRDTKWVSETELLDTPGLEAVAVETEVVELLATAQRCVDAGVHVHVDKPAGASYPNLARLHAAARQKGLSIQMGYMFRYNPAFEFTFAAVQNGWLGEVFEVDGVMSKKIGPASRRELSAQPGGTMFELGCHLIDPLVYMLGEPQQTTGHIRRTQPDEDDLADNMLAVLEYPRATCTVRSAVVEVDGFRRRQFIVCGDRGTIVIRPLEPGRLELTLERATADYERGTHEVKLNQSPGRYDGGWLALAQAIRGEQPLAFTPDHDLAVQRTLLKACQLPLT